jgi:aspartyl-tRNA(Asn)/glutamyl-tRNA(Gln) amidotransferase subunit B
MLAKDNYEIVIGLEVHVELATKTKLFCSCAPFFGQAPNTATCPVCLAHPGVLPVLNRQAFFFALCAASALKCKIAKKTKFDRKNYFYPDSPKAYQISQYDQPIGINGQLTLPNGTSIGITRLHLEEDAGKLNHTQEVSLVDLNRCGIPLIEIVSEPEIKSPEEARSYLEVLRQVLLYTGVSDVKMEEGSLRCDANLSLRPKGSTKLGVKTELKNLNSSRNVELALKYEATRQQELLEQGKQVTQASLRWLEDKQCTVLMRSKEEAHDYRYFSEPDLVPFTIDKQLLAEVEAALPELPDVKIQRYQELGLKLDQAEIMASTPLVANFFEQVLQCEVPIQAAFNWISGVLFAHLKQTGCTIEDCLISAKQLAELINLLEQNTISSKMAKEVFVEMSYTGEDPAVIVKEQGLTQLDDQEQLQKVLDKVLAAHPQSVEDFLAGKDRAFGFIVGQVMRETKGQAAPQLLTALLKEKLKK